MNQRNVRTRYWRAYERSIDPPAGAAARNLAAIERRVAAGDRVDLAEPRHASPKKAAAAGVVLWGKAAAVSVSLGVGALLCVKVAVVGWTSMTQPTEPPQDRSTPAAVPQRSTPDAPATAPALAPAPAATPSPKPAPLAAEDVPPAPVPAVARPGRAPAPTGPRADDLREELAVMQRARAALSQKDASLLWKVLDEHARRFPSGALTQERQAWRAVAACRLGHADASTRAARFLRAHPDSPQVSRVQSECVPVGTMK